MSFPVIQSPTNDGFGSIPTRIRIRNRDEVVIHIPDEPMSDTSDSLKKDFEITIEDVWIRIRVRAGTVITADLIFSVLKQVVYK
jgi:hypothetical protein